LAWLQTWRAGAHSCVSSCMWSRCTPLLLLLLILAATACGGSGRRHAEVPAVGAGVAVHVPSPHNSKISNPCGDRFIVHSQHLTSGMHDLSTSTSSQQAGTPWAQLHSSRHTCHTVMPVVTLSPAAATIKGGRGKLFLLHPFRSCLDPARGRGDGGRVEDGGTGGGGDNLGWGKHPATHSSPPSRPIAHTCVASPGVLPVVAH
jgi:hypothetical protein